MALVHSETGVQNKVEMYARARNWEVFVIDYSGWPDRLFVSPRGVHVWIEFKFGIGALAQRQRARKVRLLKMGCAVYTCDTAQQGRHIIDYWQRMDPPPLPREGSEIDDPAISCWGSTRSGAG